MSLPPAPSAPDLGVNPQNPWLGLDSFTETLSDYFYGREEEADELFRLVNRESLTVLFGQSGLGKTSLLQAGLFPKLRHAELFPIYIRLDHSEAAPPLATQVLDALKKEADIHLVEVPAPPPNETLWEYFHRKDVEFWSAETRLLTPILVLDQFEEIFTLGRMSPAARERGRDFLTELADLIENRPPAALKEKLEAGPGETGNFYFKQQFGKVILSLREDYLPELDSLRDLIRGIRQNQMRLLKMNGDQAYAAVAEPGKELIEKDVATQIVRFVAGSGVTAAGPTVAADRLTDLEVEPALLSLVCRELNYKRKKQDQPKITADLLAGQSLEILATYYERCLADLAPSVRVFVEDRLLTRTGMRDNIALDNALAEDGVTREVINKLVNRRLLRLEVRRSGQRVELTHDVLTDVIRASRDARQQRETTEAAERQLMAEREAAEKRLQRQQEAAQQRLREDREAAETRRREEALVQAQREKKQYRRGLAVISLVLILASISLVRAIVQKQRAEKANQLALSRELAASALLQLQNDPELSVLLASEAAKISPVGQAEEVLRKSLFASHLRAVIRGPGNTPSSAAISPDGQFVIAVGEDNSVRVWEASTGGTVAALTNFPGKVNSATISSGGQLMVTTGDDNLAFVWEVTTGLGVSELKGHADRVFAAAFSTNSQFVVTASNDGTARVWEARTGNSLAILDGPAGLLTSAVFSPDGQQVMTISADSTATIWEVRTRRPVTKLSGHASRVTSALFSPDGKLAVTTSADSTARLWDAQTGSLLFELKGHRDTVNDAAFSAGGKYVVTVSFDGTALVWETNTGRQVSELRGPTDNILAGRFTRNDQAVITFSPNNTLRVWDPGTGRPIAEHSASVVNGAFSPDNQLVATASGDTAGIWDARPGRAAAINVTNLVVPDAKSFSMAFSPDSRWIAIGNDDNTVRVSEVGTWRSVTNLAGHQAFVNSVAFSPNGQLLVSASGDGTARVWEVGTWRSVTNLIGDNGNLVNSAAFSPDGKCIVTAGESDAALVWREEAGNWRFANILRKPTAPVLNAAFSRDGKQVFAASEDNRIWTWDVGPERDPIVVVLKGNTGTLTGAAFSPDRQFVITTSAESNVARLWNVRNGLPLTELTGHAGVVTSASFSRDGRFIVTTSVDGTARVYACEECGAIDELLTIARKRVTRELTPEERLTFLHRP